MEKMKATKAQENVKTGGEIGANSDSERNESSGGIFRKCLHEKDLIAYKAFSFFIYGAFGSFYPFLPLFFKSYGLSSLQAGSIVGIRPFIQFFGAPFCSEIGERFQIKKLILIGGLLAWILKALFIWAVVPKHQLCIELYTNSSTNQTIVYSSNLWTKQPTNIQTLLTETSSQNELVTMSVPSKALNKENGKKIINQVDSIVKSSSMPSFNAIKITSAVDRFDKNLSTTITYSIGVDSNEIEYLYLIFLLIIIIGEFVESPVYTLSDASLLMRLGEERQYYGQIRLWGAIGWASSTASTGVILYATRSLMCTVLNVDYRVIFYIYFGFVPCAMLCACWFSFPKVDDQENPSLRKVLKVLCSLDHVIFLVTILFAGCCYGFLFHFVNWYIDDKGGSTLVMGAAGAARELGEITLFLLGGGCVRILGNLNCMAVCLICYAACFYWYSIINSPWMAVPLEILDGAVYGLVWSNSINYMSTLGSPIGAVVIMQGILQGVFYGLGNGGGTVLSGHLYEAIGPQMTFHYFAISSLVVSLLLLVLYPLSKSLNK